MSWEVREGDCLKVMASLPENSVDAVVTDPPYNLSFMGRTWDSFKGQDVDPAFLHWFAGFVDGEGCFSVHKKNVNGYETYDCQFSITLRADDRPILERIHRTLGVGTLSKPAAHRTGKDNPKARYSVSAKAELVALRDIFRAFPLRAKKGRDLELWSDALDAWLRHEPGEWQEMADARARLMASREYVEEGVRVDPFQLWTWRWAREAYRVLKPGGHLLSFGGTRTSHRMVAGIEDAGFEIRDTVAWLFGAGFPKSLDISKAIDKAKGAEREVVPIGSDGAKRQPRAMAPGGSPREAVQTLSEPVSEEAERWQGWGTALKPAHEPLVLARKPLSERNVAANVERWGTGGLNIAGGRLSARGEAQVQGAESRDGSTIFGAEQREAGKVYESDLGRWPPNVALDEEAAAMLDEQSGDRRAGGPDGESNERPGYDGGWGPSRGLRSFGDSGGASRFLYVAKADRAEREIGLGHLRKQFTATMGDGIGGREHSPDEPRAYARNNHPTVKPIALMAWLCRLVTPKGGLILDPFAGSGSTGIAALREGFSFLGIEREPEYVEIARARIEGDAPLFNAMETS